MKKTITQAQICAAIEALGLTPKHVSEVHIQPFDVEWMEIQRPNHIGEFGEIVTTRHHVQATRTH